MFFKNSKKFREITSTSENDVGEELHPYPMIDPQVIVQMEFRHLGNDYLNKLFYTERNIRLPENKGNNGNITSFYALLQLPDTKHVVEEGALIFKMLKGLYLHSYSVVNMHQVFNICYANNSCPQISTANDNDFILQNTYIDDVKYTDIVQAIGNPIRQAALLTAMRTFRWNNNEDGFESTCFIS